MLNSPRVQMIRILALFTLTLLPCTCPGSDGLRRASASCSAAVACGALTHRSSAVMLASRPWHRPV